MREKDHDRDRHPGQHDLDDVVDDGDAVACGVRRHEDELDDDVEAAVDERAGPERQASAAQLARQVRSAMMTMATSDRLVLTLRHFSECSYEEMAQILEIDEKTVKSRLFEARRRLRGLLQDWK